MLSRFIIPTHAADCVVLATCTLATPASLTVNAPEQNALTPVSKPRQLAFIHCAADAALVVLVVHARTRRGLARWQLSSRTSTGAWHARARAWKRRMKR